MWIMVFVVILANGEPLPMTERFEFKNTCESRLTRLRADAVRAMKEGLIQAASGDCRSPNVHKET